MALRERPWSVAAAAALGLAGLAELLAVSGFGAQRSSAPGGWSKAITLAGEQSGSLPSCDHRRLRRAASAARGASLPP
jgi:hypothetical protein